MKFVDVPTAVGLHLGSRSNRAYTVEAEGDELDYYLIAGTPKEIVTAYTELTAPIELTATPANGTVAVAIRQEGADIARAEVGLAVSAQSRRGRERHG